MSQNTYFCSCLGPSCKCADRLWDDIVETLTETEMSAFDIAESVGVDVGTVRATLAIMIDHRIVKRIDRGMRRTYDLAI